MNALAVVGVRCWELEAWREPQRSGAPTLVGSAVTLVAVLALWVASGGGWPVFEADFGRLPPVEEGPPAVAGPSFREPEPEGAQRLLAPTFYLVASEESAAVALPWLAVGAQEEATGVAGSPAGLRLLRWVDTPEREAAVLEEVWTASEAWAPVGQGVGVVVVVW